MASIELERASVNCDGPRNHKSNTAGRRTTTSSGAAICRVHSRHSRAKLCLDGVGLASIPLIMAACFVGMGEIYEFILCFKAWEKLCYKRLGSFSVH